MKIGLIGWYGHSNFGDERILYCIKRYFSDYEFFITGSWEEAKQNIIEVNRCDYILIGGGGLILRNIGHQIELIRNLKKPFSLIGVSAEAKHKSMEEFFEIIKERAEFILVRDRQSKNYFDDHYKVILGPDLTFLYPFDVASEVKDDICGLNLRDWCYWSGTLHGNYYNVMSKINAKFPFIEYVYPFKKWEPNKTVMCIMNNFKSVLPMPFYFETNTLNDHDILSRYFKNVPQTFKPDLYNSIHYLIGMRFHSIVFATQCGIPFISLSYQPKNAAFCSDMGLDILSMDIYKMNQLEDKIADIRDNYDTFREHLISYRERYNRDINYIFQSIS